MNDNDKLMGESLKARSRAAFDRQAATYDEDMHGRHARGLYPFMLDAIAGAVASIPSPRLLDVGCGTGALSQAVLERVGSCRLCGIDLSPTMLRRAHERLGNASELVLGDVERLPFRDGAFDAAWCNDSFHHYPDPEKAAFQMWRVLRRGGTLVIGDIWQAAPARAIMNAWMPHSSEGDVRIYSERELRGILGTWFIEVSWRRIGTSACLAIARK